MLSCVHVLDTVHELAEAPVTVALDVDELVVVNAVHVPSSHVPGEDSRQKDVEKRGEHVVQALNVPAAGVGARSDVQDSNKRALERGLGEELDRRLGPRRVDGDLPENPELLLALWAARVSRSQDERRGKNERGGGSASDSIRSVASHAGLTSSSSCSLRNES